MARKVRLSRCSVGEDTILPCNLKSYMEYIRPILRGLCGQHIDEGEVYPSYFLVNSSKRL